MFQWEEGEKGNPVKVLDKRETCVRRQKKNKRIARHKLKLRKQYTSESFDNFVKDLRLIVMDCKYTDLDDILIDSIIDGVHAKKLQERLIDRGEHLAKAIQIGQQYEMSQKQVRFVRDEEPLILALDLKKTKNPKNSKKPDSRKGKHCPRCGKDPQHDWNQGKCPALGSTCSYCKKPNHWLAVCNRRLRVHKIHIPKYSATLLHGLQPG